MKIKLQNNHFFPLSKPPRVRNLFETVSLNEKSDSKRNLAPDKYFDTVLRDGSVKTSLTQAYKVQGVNAFQFPQGSNEITYKSSRSNVEKDLKIDDLRGKIVLDGLNGESSIAEICLKENISHETFLKWSREFLSIKNFSLKRTFKTSKLQARIQFLDECVNSNLKKYLESYIDLHSPKTYYSESSIESEVNMKHGVHENFVCLYNVNDVRYINKHFEMLNRNMLNGDVLIGRFETFQQRRKKSRINKIPFISYLYFGFEFLISRVLPKLSISKKYYFNYTKGKNRLLSKAETLGRLVCCGFTIKDHISIDGLTYFVAKKSGSPKYDYSPSYGPVYAMPRIGKNGKMIKVFKFRTMHPYSEYLQDYIIRSYGYADTGKPANDFRVPEWGKIMRRFWLDEIPQLINVVKGEMKLVGVRPVSQRYFQDIPNEMRKLRRTQKPGCIPPYVALNRKGNVMSVLQSEKDYLEAKIKNPYSTDIQYFFQAIFNIVFKHKRSA